MADRIPVLDGQTWKSLMGVVFKSLQSVLVGAAVLSAVCAAFAADAGQKAAVRAKAAAESATTAEEQVRRSFGRDPFNSQPPQAPPQPWSMRWLHQAAGLPWELYPEEGETSAQYLKRLRALDERTSRRRFEESDRAYSERLDRYTKTKVRIAKELDDYYEARASYEANQVVHKAAEKAAAPFWAENSRQRSLQAYAERYTSGLLHTSAGLLAASVALWLIVVLYRSLARPALVAAVREVHSINEESKRTDH